LRNARAVLHVVLAVAVTGVAGYLSRSPALTFLLGFVALHTMAMEIAYPPREGRPERGPRYRVVLGFALLGVVAWAICRAAQSAWGEQVGPGVACLLIIWTSEIRHRVAGREQD
jgi:hypothetical protein